MGCARDRTLFLYACIGLCLILGVYSLFKFIFSVPKLFFNFKSMPILGKPLRRCFIFFVPIVFSLILIFIIALTMISFVAFMTSGYNINIKAGPDFYMPEVRKTYMTWYAYYGSFLLLFMMYLYVSFFIGLQRTLIATLISQYYFSKTKDYLKGTVYKGYRKVFKHIGTLFYHALSIALAWPFRKMFGCAMHYFNGIKFANGFHILLIKCCTCCVRFYETRWKYRFSQALYQVEF